MGWKKLKEHFNIGHFVTIHEKGICIGSPYIHDIIVIGRDGVITKRDDGRANEDIARYQQNIDADPELVKQLIEAEDQFERSILVYTYSGSQILEKYCEQPGWPNVTHDGEMMYENMFSTDKAQVVIWAKKNLQAGIEMVIRELNDIEERQKTLEDKLEEARDGLKCLAREYPESK